YPLSVERFPPLYSLHSFPTRRSSDLFSGFAFGSGRSAKARACMTIKLRTNVTTVNNDFIFDLPFKNLHATEYKIIINGRYVGSRSEEHTSELQSRGHLVCRLLLEKKK